MSGIPGRGTLIPTLLAQSRRGSAAGNAAGASMRGVNEMADDWGIYDRDEGPACCEHCEEPLEWEDCDLCGGEGEFDWERLQEEDPLWYQPGDVEKCTQCGGAG